MVLGEGEELGGWWRGIVDSTVWPIWRQSSRVLRRVEQSHCLGPTAEALFTECERQGEVLVHGNVPITDVD